MARRLADLYAERLMSCADDPAKYADTLQRIETLIRDFPQANTTALQVMLLQADYNRAESLLTAWINDPQAEASRSEAQQILTRITPLLVQHDEELTKQAETLLAQLDEMPEGDALQTRELEVKRVQGMAARAGYFAAWANYYLGLVTNAATSAEPYVKARSIFRRLFGFDDTLPSDVDAQWLGLETIWRSRSLIGLGLSEAACGDQAACDRCFELIEHASVPPEIKDQAPYWRLRALLASGQYTAAETYARQRVEQLRLPATQGQVSFCVALVREGFAAAGPKDARAQQALGQLGLTRSGASGPAGGSDRVDRQVQDPGRQESRLRAVVGGRAAAIRRRRDIQGPGRLSDRGPHAAVGTRNRRKPTRWPVPPPAAATHWPGATTARANSKPPPGNSRPPSPAWKPPATRWPWNRPGWPSRPIDKLVESQPRLLANAAEALKRIQRSFPDHPYAKRAEYEMARLMDKNDPETFASQLESIPESDANYAQARYRPVPACATGCGRSSAASHKPA